MSILIDEKTKIVVQGITGNQGKFHTRAMIEYGSNIVAGVTPGKGGASVLDIPVYNKISEIDVKVNASIIFVPAKFAKNAALEAFDTGLDTVVIITEHIPVHDSIEIMAIADKYGVNVIGPNTPGVISPGKSKMGVMPNKIFKPGNVGIISRSGTLTYEIVENLTNTGLGQSTAVGIGGDPIIGLGFIELLEQFENDNETHVIVLIGEIGGSAEELAAEYIKSEMSKPVVAYVAGRTAPKGKTMGHAGAIIARGTGTARSKIKALTQAGVKIADKPGDIPNLIQI